MKNFSSELLLLFEENIKKPTRCWLFYQVVSWKRGRVGLSRLSFVRINCILIAALVIRIVILRTEQVTMSKMQLNESEEQLL